MILAGKVVKLPVRKLHSKVEPAQTTVGKTPELLDSADTNAEK